MKTFIEHLIERGFNSDAIKEIVEGIKASERCIAYGVSDLENRNGKWVISQTLSVDTAAANILEDLLNDSEAVVDFFLEKNANEITLFPSDELGKCAAAIRFEGIKINLDEA